MRRHVFAQSATPLQGHPKLSGLMSAPAGPWSAVGSQCVDPIVVACESFMHRAHADHARLESLQRSSVPGERGARGALSERIARVETLAASVEALRQLTAQTHEYCDSKLLGLPCSAALREEFEATRSPDDGISCVLAPLLAKLGLGVDPYMERSASAGLSVVASGQGDGYAIFPSASSGRCQRKGGYGPAGVLGTAASATAASLRDDLRRRMARRLQTAWRGCVAWRTLRRRIVCRKLLLRLDKLRREGLRIALISFRVASAAIAAAAATNIARLARGHLARRRAGIQQRKLEAALSREGLARRVRLLTVLATWQHRVQRAARWRAVAFTTADRTAPLTRFWKLFPTDGKGAVAMALRSWSLWRRVVVRWAREVSKS